MSTLPLLVHFSLSFSHLTYSFDPTFFLKLSFYHCNHTAFSAGAFSSPSPTQLSPCNCHFFSCSLRFLSPPLNSLSPSPTQCQCRVLTSGSCSGSCWGTTTPWRGRWPTTPRLSLFSSPLFWCRSWMWYARQKCIISTITHSHNIYYILTCPSDVESHVKSYWLQCP